MDVKQIERLTAYVAARRNRRGLHDDIIHSIGTDADSIDLLLSDVDALLQLARAVQNATQATVYTDSVSIDGEQVYELSPIDDHDEAAIKKFHGQTVALVPVPTTEGKYVMDEEMNIWPKGDTHE